MAFPGGLLNGVTLNEYGAVSQDEFATIENSQPAGTALLAALGLPIRPPLFSQLVDSANTVAMSIGGMTPWPGFNRVLFADDTDAFVWAAYARNGDPVTAPPGITVPSEYNPSSLTVILLLILAIAVIILLIVNGIHAWIAPSTDGGGGGILDTFKVITPLLPLLILMLVFNSIQGLMKTGGE